MKYLKISGRRVLVIHERDPEASSDARFCELCGRYWSGKKSEKSHRRDCRGVQVRKMEDLTPEQREKIIGWWEIRDVG